MNAEEMVEVLEDLLRSLADDEDGDAVELQGARLVSFRRAGLLTRDAGVVITLADGAELQIAVVQSRIGERDDEDAAAGNDDDDDDDDVS